MLANYHTHTTHCDGANTPEEVVLAALEKGFDIIGFSGHAITGFDKRYCMKDLAPYRAEILQLKEKYKDRIRIYLGVEEDMYQLVRRDQYDYIIGSCHYIYKDGVYYSVDSGIDYQQRCLEAFGGDPLKMAEAYFSAFCEYIHSRKPDIIGHFDLLTKYDESGGIDFLGDPAYIALAKKYLAYALESGCVFEVNMGAMARGIRTSPYPSQELLHLLCKENAKLVLSSDSHSIDTLDYSFNEAEDLLRSIGFKERYIFENGKFCPVNL